MALLRSLGSKRTPGVPSGFLGYVSLDTHSVGLVSRVKTNRSTNTCSFSLVFLLDSIRWVGLYL